MTTAAGPSHSSKQQCTRFAAAVARLAASRSGPARAGTNPGQSQKDYTGLEQVSFMHSTLQIHYELMLPACNHLCIML